jgi:uncharacterized protein (DUF736 family)
MKIGSFMKDPKNIIHGKIHGLGVGAIPVMFEPQTSRDGKSYFRIIAEPVRDAYEVGVAFPKEKDGMDYHSVSLDSPLFPNPIHAALFPDKETEGCFNLVWNRLENETPKPAPEKTYEQHRRAIMSGASF